MEDSKSDWNASDTITPEEEVLNAHLESKGLKFIRQYEITRLGEERSYWLDFAWPEKKVAIEIDGHPINLSRELYLINLGWRLIHVQNEHFRIRKTQRSTFSDLLEILYVLLNVPNPDRKYPSEEEAREKLRLFLERRPRVKP